ncbi:MAG TPA: hypothetical protein DD473_03810 [Planctomycetaceae bacterium]|nr:hypothetical protein [Planctomycetaceae bacterium]
MIWLDNSRILAIYAVVVLHVAAGVVTGNEIGSEYWWIGNIYNSLVRWCVPVFVMISGALMLHTSKKEDLTVFYKKRLSRVLIPIIVWSLFYSGWAVLKASIKGEKIYLVDLLNRVLDGMPHYHMWFLYMILILYLFTPFLRPIVACFSRRDLSVLVVFTFLMAAINYAYIMVVSAEPRPSLFINWFLLYLPYYFLGHLIREDDVPRSTVLLWLTFVVSSLVTSVGCYLVSIRNGLDSGLYFYGYLSVSVIPMSISAMYLLKKLNAPIINSEFIRKMSALTLGVYLIHPVLLEVINQLGYGANDYKYAISVPVIASGIFASSLAISWGLYSVSYLKRII